MYMKKYIATPDVSLKSSLKVEIFYNKGKWILMSLRTVEIENCDWYKTESFMMFGNSKDRFVLVKPMQRYSAKVFDSICSIMKEVKDTDYLAYYHNPVSWQVVSQLVSII